MNNNIEKLNIENKLTPKGVVTISIGVRVMEETVVSLGFEAIIDSIDRALYVVKNSGKGFTLEYASEMD